MSSKNTESYDLSTKLESNGGNTGQLERLQTDGGHTDDRTQPSLPVVHRRFANPAPLGLLSFATGVIIFFGGVCQFISGIMEFVSGNTFGATVFPSYGAFNIAYAMIYLPGSGIIAAYTDAKTGELNSEFNNALGIWLWAWFILTVIFTVAAMRSSWVLFLLLAFLDVDLTLLACGYMLDMPSLLKAGNAVGFVVAILSYWAGTAGLYANGIAPINIPVFPMYTEPN